MAVEDALKTVVLRNNFYRDNYRRVVITLLLMVLVNIGILGVLAWNVTHPRPPAYFATTPDGKILPLIPLRQPMVSQAELLSWTTQVAVSVYNFSFVNWRKQLQDAAANFSPEGWQSYQNALKKSRNLETVISKKLVVTAVPTGAPVILNQGVIRGRYSWKVNMPMLVTYQSASTTFQQPVTVTLLVSRIPVLNNPKGIAVVSFFVAQQSVGQGNAGLPG